MTDCKRKTHLMEEYQKEKEIKETSNDIVPQSGD